MAKTIRWGILGCGDVTEKKSGPAFYKCKNSTLNAVMRRDAKKAQDYAKRHDVPTWYDNAQALIDDPNIDAIYIATRPDTHKEYALRCAESSKIALVEKPLGRDANEAQAIVDSFASRNIPLFCAYYRRALPRFIYIKKMIEDGIIGKIRFVRITQLQPEPSDEINNSNLPWRLDPSIGGGGIFADMGSHEIDILDFFLGPIEDVQGMALNQASRYPAEDIVIGNFSFVSGEFATGLWSYASHDHEDEVRIVGSTGEIRFSCFSCSPIEIVTKKGNETIDIPDPPHVHQPLIQSIVDELNGESVCPSTPQSGLRVNQIIDRMLDSYRLESSKISR